MKQLKIVVEKRDFLGRLPIIGLIVGILNILMLFYCEYMPNVTHSYFGTAIWLILEIETFIMTWLLMPFFILLGIISNFFGYPEMINQIWDTKYGFPILLFLVPIVISSIPSLILFITVRISRSNNKVCSVK